MNDLFCTGTDMVAIVSRRSFLRRTAQRPAPVRPPWALAEADFRTKCTRCDECAKACPEGIIVVTAGLPQINFKRGHCTFCGDCLKACEAGALKIGDGCDNLSDSRPWSLGAHFNRRCIAAKGTECRICGEQCEAEAIRFQPRKGGPPLPVVDGTACTGCGACLAPCPTNAVVIAAA